MSTVHIEMQNQHSVRWDAEPEQCMFGGQNQHNVHLQWRAGQRETSFPPHPFFFPKLSGQSLSFT